MADEKPAHYGQAQPHQATSGHVSGLATLQPGLPQQRWHLSVLSHDSEVSNTVRKRCSTSATHWQVIPLYLSHWFVIATVNATPQQQAELHSDMKSVLTLHCTIGVCAGARLAYCNQLLYIVASAEQFELLCAFHTCTCTPLTPRRGALAVYPQAVTPSYACRSHHVRCASHPTFGGESHQKAYAVFWMAIHCAGVVNGLTLPPLYFGTGGVKALFAALKQVRILKAVTQPVLHQLAQNMGLHHRTPSRHH